MLRLPVKGDRWADTPSIVVVTDIQMQRRSLFKGELRLYLDCKTWPKNPALIHQDEMFLTSLKRYLARLNYKSDDITYSEKPGEDHVAITVGEKFLESWLTELRGY